MTVLVCTWLWPWLLLKEKQENQWINSSWQHGAVTPVTEVITVNVKWLTVGEVQQQTGIPERTIRRYLDIHGHHIQTRRQGRSVLVAEEAVPILRQIRGWYDAGWSAERVEEALAESGFPVTVTLDDRTTTVTATEALQRLQKSLDTAMTAIEEIQQQVAEVQKENRAMREYIEQHLEERDRKLTEVLREIREAKAQRKGWWPWRR